VQKGHEDEGVRAPVVNVPDQASEQDLVLKVQNRFIGLVREGLVNKLQENSSSQKEEHEHNRHAAQSPREGPAKRVFRDAPRPEVKYQAVEKPAVSFPYLFCSYYAWENGIEDTLKDIEAVRYFVLLRHRVIFGKPSKIAYPYAGSAALSMKPSNQKSEIRSYFILVK
jgi:hypothetical protein